MKTRYLHILFTIFISLYLIACGGGSIGTGTGESRLLEGRTVDLNGDPLAGVLISIAQTGESTETGSDGRFELNTDSTSRNINLLVDYKSVSQNIAVNLEDTSTADALNVKITIDPRVNNIVVEKLQVKVKVVGKCDYYFENHRIIRQANALADGTECQVAVEIYGDGRLLEHVPFVIQNSQCDGKKWSDIATGQTGFGIKAGRGTLNFKYYNDEAHCVYRVVAPHKVKSLEPIYYEIHTYKKQAYDHNR